MNLSKYKKLNRLARFIAVLALVLVALVVNPGVVQAAPLTNVSIALSNNQISQTSVTYTWQFTTATIGTVASVNMTVPSGTGGTPAIASNYGISAGSVGSITANTITYTVTTPASIASGTPILIAISGLTNTSTAGSYTSTVTTLTSTPTTIDSATTASFDIAATGVSVATTVAKSLTFTIDASSLTFLLDPSLSGLTSVSKTVNLTVKTNAVSGYSVSVKSSAADLHTSLTAFSANKAAPATWGSAVDKWGYTVSGTGCTVDSAFSGTKYAGFTTDGEAIFTASGPTGETAHTAAMVVKIAIDYAAAAGTYTPSLTFTATPTY